MNKIKISYGWVLVFFCFLGGAANAAPSKPLPKLLQEVEAKYFKAATLSADFTQEVQDKVLNEKKISTGKIFVKRPSKMRWDTQKPNPSLLVSDGIHFWLYTPPFDEGERGQVIERKSSAVQSRLANALLSGSFSIAKEMKITQRGPAEFLLTPKPGTAGTVTQATLKIDPKALLITKVGLNHKGGNHSEISLSQIKLGEPLEARLFTFEAPPNTDKIVE